MTLAPLLQSFSFYQQWQSATYGYFRASTNPQITHGKEFFSAVAISLTFMALLPYLLSVLRGKIKPYKSKKTSFSS